VNNFSYKARGASSLVKQVVCATVLLAGASAAQAGKLDFEGAVEMPFMYAGQHTVIGDYWIESYGGPQSGDLVGAIVDGSDSGICVAPISCPVNNASQYYAGLDDGYFYFGLNSGSHFKVSSLKASFIGTGQSSLPAVSALLVLQGFNDNGSLLGGAFQIPLYGPTNNQFSFTDFNLSSIPYEYSYVRLLPYLCDASGSCSRGGGVANFAVDDIVTIPEPASMALFGLGLAGIGAMTRRRRAV
jgi:hypothetical protein